MGAVSSTFWPAYGPSLLFWPTPLSEAACVSPIPPQYRSALLADFRLHKHREHALALSAGLYCTAEHRSPHSVVMGARLEHAGHREPLALPSFVCHGESTLGYGVVFVFFLCVACNRNSSALHAVSSCHSVEIAW